MVMGTKRRSIHFKPRLFPPLASHSHLSRRVGSSGSRGRMPVPSRRPRQRRNSDTWQVGGAPDRRSIRGGTDVELRRCKNHEGISTKSLCRKSDHHTSHQHQHQQQQTQHEMMSCTHSPPCWASLHMSHNST